MEAHIHHQQVLVLFHNEYCHFSKLIYLIDLNLQTTNTGSPSKSVISY